jgi:PAS domain S-box-containing protein
MSDLLSSDQAADWLRLIEKATDAASEGITLSDTSQPDNPIIHANEGFERLTGYSRKDMIGQNCRFLQGPDADPETVDQIRQALNEGIECTVELLNRRKDGMPFWNRLSIAPIRDRDGQTTHFVGVSSPTLPNSKRPRHDSRSPARDWRNSGTRSPSNSSKPGTRRDSSYRGSFPRRTRFGWQQGTFLWPR